MYIMQVADSHTVVAEHHLGDKKPYESRRTAGFVDDVQGNLFRIDLAAARISDRLKSRDDIFDSMIANLQRANDALDVAAGSGE